MIFLSLREESNYLLWQQKPQYISIYNLQTFILDAINRLSKLLNSYLLLMVMWQLFLKNIGSVSTL